MSYYNINAQKYFKDTVNADVTELYKPFLSRLKPNSHILDAGCGSGRDSLYFLNNGYKVTSFDASEEMAKLATELISREVIVQKFQDISWENKFDGIWACATLLHVPQSEIHGVFHKLAKSLKSDGIIYGSFKYGSGERIKADGRRFLDMNEEELSNIIDEINTLTIEKTWITTDVRPGREKDKWLNFIVSKYKRS